MLLSQTRKQVTADHMNSISRILAYLYGCTYVPIYMVVHKHQFIIIPQRFAYNL